MSDLKILNDLVILLARLTAARAGYLDELAAANIPLDIDRLIQAGIAVSGAVSDAGAAVTDFDTNLTEATDNHYNGMLLLSTSGVTAGQAHQVDVYTGGAKNVAFAASDQWTEAPANGSTFVLLPNPGAYLKKIFAAMATSAEIAALDAVVNKAVFFKDQWCATPIASLAFSNVAGDKDFSNVVLPAGFLPAGYVIQAVHLMVHWRKQVDTSAALNAINAANKTIRVKKAADGWAASLVAITMANGGLSTALSATEGGTIIIGNVDIKATVSADNTTYNIRSDETTCADGITVTAASLTLWDIYTGLRIFFTVA